MTTELSKSSRPMGVALIGTGMVSGTYADAISNLSDVTLIGALATRPEKAAAFLRKNEDKIGSSARVYSNVEEIASDPAVDFVCLTTPPNARREIVELLAKAGKPILMEKPVERTLPAAREICELCDAAGVLLGIVLQHRARPSAQVLRERVNSDFGALRAVEISVPWWRPQSYYDEAGRGTYARDGGGVMISQAIHTLDLALQFAGPVASVTALTATTGFHAMEAEDFVSAGLTFENGAVGSFTATTASFPGRAEEIVLHYSNVSARLQAGLLVLDWQDGKTETIGESGDTGAGADPMAFTSDWHGAMIKDFAQALRLGREPMAPGRSALAVHAVIEAIERSGRGGRRVELTA